MVASAAPSQEIREWMKDRIRWSNELRDLLTKHIPGEIISQLDSLTREDVQQMIRELNEERAKECINQECFYVKMCQGLSLCMKLRVIQYYRRQESIPRCPPFAVEDLSPQCNETLSDELKQQIDESRSTFIDILKAWAIIIAPGFLGLCISFVFFIYRTCKEEKKKEEETKKSK